MLISVIILLCNYYIKRGFFYCIKIEAYIAKKVVLVVFLLITSKKYLIEPKKIIGEKPKKE
jgi:hypothetical protein